MEKDYLKANLSAPKSAVAGNPPYRKIMTSLPFIATTVAGFGHQWGLITIQTGTPTYLSNIQHFSLSQVF